MYKMLRPPTGGIAGISRNAYEKLNECRKEPGTRLCRAESCSNLMKSFPKIAADVASAVIPKLNNQHGK